MTYYPACGDFKGRQPLGYEIAFSEEREIWPIRDIPDASSADLSMSACEKRDGEGADGQMPACERTGSGQ